jgi:hypothetical protein
MGKGKFVKTKHAKRKYLGTFAVLPYGILKLYKIGQKYTVETQDICPRCALKITSGIEIKTFLHDIKQVFKDVRQAARDLKILELNDEIEAIDEDSAPSYVPEIPFKKDDFSELEDLNKII